MAQETPDDGQALIDPLVPGAAETASAGHAGQAQRLIQAVASGRQDAWRVAEDLAMALLMSKADKRHHEAARLVLKDRDLRIPRALELAVKLLGPAPKVKPSPKKR